MAYKQYAGSDRNQIEVLLMKEMADREERFMRKLNDQEQSIRQLEVKNQVQQSEDSARAVRRLEEPVSQLRHKVMILGGERKLGVLSDTNELFNVRHQQSSTCKLKLDPLRMGHASVLDGSILYTIGGFVRDTNNKVVSVFNSIDVFDASFQLHLDCLHMNKKRFCAAAAQVGDKVLIFGGRNREMNLCSCESLDTKSNSLGTAPDYMPQCRWWHTAELMGGRVALIGGCVGCPTPSNSVIVYDPNTNTYDTNESTNLSQARAGHASSVLGSNIVVTGGRNEEDKTLSSCEQLDTRTGQWMKMSDMNTRRQGHALVNVGDRLVAIGGWDASNVLDTVEVYESRMDKWITLEAKLLEPRLYFTAHVL